jgi:hypothetical protein
MLNQRKLKDADEARAALDAAERDGRGRVAWARANGVDARSLNAWRVNPEAASEGRGPASGADPSRHQCA